MFISLLVLSQKICFFHNLDSFHTTVVTNGLLEPYFLLTNSLFSLCLSYVQGMFILGEICPISDAKIRKPAENHQPVHYSLIKHSVSAHLSVRYMET